MVELKYFPQEKEDLNFILDVYAAEIQIRANWIIETAEEINTGLKNYEQASSTIRKCMDLIGNAIVILRIIDHTFALKVEKEKAKERVELILQRWPEINNQKAPEGLRSIRNDYEHFESRLDTWATTSKNRLIADMNIGPEIYGLGTHENLRRFEGDTLYFWDRSVNLSEVVKWSMELSNVVKKK